jgi:hypothetical protein
MTEYLVGMAINILLTTIAMALKDPNKREQYRKALTKVRDNINLLYPE